ncbi:MAG: extracellular solute-binding protein [Oscillospiraceae bacterium]|nr:extracellular solute-binding protein [Oscillospiraceae bacterium]
MKTKKIGAIIVTALILMTTLLAGCAGTTDKIAVISREDGSGTRGAFIELFGIEVKGEDGTKKDTTTKEAMIAKQTDVMMVSVAGDKSAIGYISLGSLNDTVKAVAVDGAAATTDNVKNGSYKVSRPFVIATKGDATEVAQDFIDYILSSEGQAVVAKSYIAVSDSAPAYSGSKPSGKVVVAGSSSVTPIMEKLKEAYIKINPNATIEVQQSDSSTGLASANSGTCDIAMSSRDLKEDELATLTPINIAIDGIAVIVNKENTATDLSSEQIKGIFTGEITSWSELE